MTMDRSTLLSISGAHKEYALPGRSIVAFTGIELDLVCGEILCILGPSGCGKSTLLRVIAGLEPMTKGRITLRGERIEGPHPKVGIVFQEARLLPWLTLRENVAFAQRFASNRRGGRHGTEVDALIDRLGLSEFGDAYPAEISGGMAQRAALARALVRHPDLLLFDEPFAALDAFRRMELQQWVAQTMKDRGAAGIFVTHDIDEALFLGDRIILMSPHPGRVTRVITNPVMHPRGRDEAMHFELRREIMSQLVLQEDKVRASGGGADEIGVTQRVS